MTIWARSRRTNIITAYVIAVVILFVGRELFSPDDERVEDALIFISDFDSIDASRNANSVYRVGHRRSALMRAHRRLNPAWRWLSAHQRYRLRAGLAAACDRQPPARSQRLPITRC